MNRRRRSDESAVPSSATPRRYDDGGFVGGTRDRPAPRRPLRDTERGLVDVIAVHWIDRLSRSLTDFAELVEVMQAHGVVFVCVTQSVDTATSIRRRTLDILLSFTQLEREVIGERTRDKVAAAKARGMWIGGAVPLGYAVRDRTLVVMEPFAARVRRLFDLFAGAGLGAETVRQSREEGITSRSVRLAPKSACRGRLGRPGR